jgi:hypothetical protein
MHTSTPLPSTTPAAARFDPDRCTRMLQTLQAKVDCGRLPGAVALIARQGRVLLHEAIGSLDPAKGTPMPLDAIFRI